MQWLYFLHKAQMLGEVLPGRSVQGRPRSPVHLHSPKGSSQLCQPESITLLRQLSFCTEHSSSYWRIYF